MRLSRWFSNWLKMWVFVPIVVVLMLCWPTSKLHGNPDESEEQILFLGADKRLQKDTKELIMVYEAIFGADCRKPKVKERQISELPGKPGESVWVEEWTVDRCGEAFLYVVTYTPTLSKGGTDVSVAPPTSVND